MIFKRSLVGVGLAGLLLAGALVPGCGLSTANMKKSLAYSSHMFDTAVRWRRHQAASRHMKPALRQPYQDRTENPEDPVRVSMVEVLRVKVVPKKNTAELRVRYHWHRINRGIQRRTMVLQHWKYSGTTWLVDRLAHRSGPRFPWFDKLKPAPPRRRPPARPPAKRPAPR